MGALEAFVEVVDRGGFTAAAERLGLSKSVVSRRRVASLHHSRSPCRGRMRTSVPGVSSACSACPMVNVPSACPTQRIVSASALRADRERTSTRSATSSPRARKDGPERDPTQMVAFGRPQRMRLTRQEVGADATQTDPSANMNQISAGWLRLPSLRVLEM